MVIGERTIGRDQPPYIIAEIGVNHDGSVERALELVDAAAEAGADAVKLQLFRADLLMSKSSKLAAYQAAAGEEDPLTMLRRLELSAEQMRPIVDRAYERGIHAIVTVFSVPLIEEAERLSWDAYKTASPDIIHLPLLAKLASGGKPIILSTGASTLDEVKRAILWMHQRKAACAVLQCVSSYPTEDDNAELGGIGAIREVFSGPIGYSDHTRGVETGAIAVSLGASILEKHLTHDRAAKGPDHSASLDVQGFARYVRLARAAKAGTAKSASPIKRVLPCEEDVRRLSRQSICTARSIHAGEALRDSDLTIKRPGTGIEPFRWSEIVGRTARRDLEADMPLTPEDLA